MTDTGTSPKRRDDDEEQRQQEPQRGGGNDDVEEALHREPTARDRPQRPRRRHAPVTWTRHSRSAASKSCSTGDDERQPAEEFAVLSGEKGPDAPACRTDAGEPLRFQLAAVTTRLFCPSSAMRGPRRNPGEAARGRGSRGTDRSVRPHAHALPRSRADARVERVHRAAGDPAGESVPSCPRRAPVVGRDQPLRQPPPDRRSWQWCICYLPPDLLSASRGSPHTCKPLQGTTRGQAAWVFAPSASRSTASPRWRAARRPLRRWFRAARR